MFIVIPDNDHLYLKPGCSREPRSGFYAMGEVEPDAQDRLQHHHRHHHQIDYLDHHIYHNGFDQWQTRSYIDYITENMFNCSPPSAAAQEKPTPFCVTCNIFLFQAVKEQDFTLGDLK